MQSRWFPALLSTVVYGVTRLSLYLLTGGVSVPMLVRTGFFLLLCASATLCDLDVLDAREVHTPTAEIGRSVSTVFVLATLLMGVSRFLIFREISMGRILAQVILLMLCATGGPLCGAAAGIVMGVCMDVSAGGSVFFTAAYGVTSLPAGLMNKHKRVVFLGVYLLVQGLTIFCLPAGPLRLPGLIETSAGALIYLILPQKLVISLGSFVQPQRSGRGESGLRHYTAGQVGSMSNAYRALYDVAQRLASCFAELFGVVELFVVIVGW